MDEQERQKRFRETEELAALRRAQVLGVEYLDMREVEGTMPLADGMLTVEEMRTNRIVPILKGDYENSNVFGITSSTPQSFIEELRSKYTVDGGKVQFDLISDSGYRALLLRYDPPKMVVYDDVQISNEGDSETLSRVSETLEGVNSDDILNYLIGQADQLGASDIHIENQRDGVRIRLRVDGALHPIARITPEKYRILFSSIASAAGLSTAATTSQTGHIVKTVPGPNGERTLNMRVETAPTAYGQDVVMRLFNFDETMLQLDMLGLSDEERQQLDGIVSHPRGMVMVVGPTGSGKSTTLYSILNALNSTQRKLVTLEDPIEYDISGVTQIPVDTDEGQSFAEGFRGVLRLDPDIVMVGEIRDADTAKTAIQASITGHLVLCTFHAQDAASAFARIIDMIGVNPIFATAIRLVIGQRLVRKLDDATKVEYEPDEATKAWVREALADLPQNVPKPDLDNFKLWKAGSSKENPFGYKGRTVLMEQMLIDEQIQAYLRGDEKEINAIEIEKSAQADGMVTMLQKGVLKALAGETTLEEVNRVL
ncbi:type IV-A pilus assembly ATPase PilB [Alphaproteobacteria bacterium]|nr:type IV-A pilus assembly ATPase PilB [Alphaproteobacteria bacterium]